MEYVHEFLQKEGGMPGTVEQARKFLMEKHELEIFDYLLDKLYNLF